MKPTLAVLFVCGTGCATPEPPPTMEESRPVPAAVPTAVHLPIDVPGGIADAVGQPVSIEARDLVLRLDGAEVRIPYLSGRLTPTGDGELVDLESPGSFEVTIDALEVRIPDQTLQHAMGGPGEKGPLRDLSVRTEGDSVLLDGHARTLHLPFSFRATPAVTDRGGLGLQLEKVRILGIGVKGFLETFQKPIETAANKRGHLLDVDRDWLVIDPFPFAGPPEIHAAFTSVEVRDHDIVARLGELTPREERKEPGGLTLTGGVLRSQKTLLFDVTVRLLAQDGGALVIDPDTLSDQIAGGIVKNGKDGNVTVYVLAPDQRPVEGIVRPPAGPEEPKTPAEPAQPSTR